MRKQSFAFLIFILSQIQNGMPASKGVYVRYYICDPSCPMDKCSEAEETEESKVCTLIIESNPDGDFVTFPNKCAFDCANKCYEYQLTSKPGSCTPNSEDGRNSLGGLMDLLPVSAGVSGAKVQDRPPEQPQVKYAVISEGDSDEDYVGKEDDDGPSSEEYEEE